MAYRPSPTELHHGVSLPWFTLSPGSSSITTWVMEWQPRPRGGVEFEHTDMTTADDTQWLERARAGDRAAFGMLVRRYQKRVHRLALHLVGNAGEADDVTQEAFLRAFKAI